MFQERARNPEKIPVAVLIGGGSKLPPLLEHEKLPETKWQIVFVVSHKKESDGVDRAKREGIEAEVRYFDFKIDNRDQYSIKLFQDVLSRLGERGVIVMAGWDLVVPKVATDLVDKNRGIIFLNLHPALLPDNSDDEFVIVDGYKIPATRGVHGNKAFEIALDEGHKFAGATVHHVTWKVDVGKVVLRGAVPVGAGDTVETLAGRVHEKEDEILPQAIDMVIANTGIA